ncbi:uncharacterized protein C8Q71DRAFT_753294 [Rhodofomes roseus]|uniref:Tetratricopeptide repeat protein n=1 Tax=Rhodofomes roseus TaxID=34475 RepID=A0ABQ8KJ96_9APHY|nr:uncharacterized protein C8Q71DRAFT_753294 [Rhodofomes roseus]KAH9837579.1 hypothetical protein C8Q71DRAFT_753294 [Rhodofomes roseus]
MAAPNSEPKTSLPTLPWGASAPASPKRPYSPESALEDVPGLHYALHLFLASQMVESEEYCKECDPKGENLYFATGYGLIQCFKGVMSFEDEDLLAALNHVKQGNAVANSHRKRAASLPTRLAGLVLGSLNTSGVGWIKSMTPVERHAELVYAETLFEKAILGIVYSGDWLAFIKEALNLRTTINIYRQLGQFVESADAEARARGDGPEDTTIDSHFRSGVCLGVGMSNVILSLMPSKVLTVIELFGYTGDRHTGLAYLMKPGGWSKDSSAPAVSVEQEGIRRPMCDMALLLFHLVFSSFTFDGVDITMAQKILDYHQTRYPDGVFFLFGRGRLSICRGQPAQAIEYYRRAVVVQDQYKNMHHISHWEIAVAHLALWDVAASLTNWRALAKDATWSKATYTYGAAVCLLELGDEKQREEAAKLMEQVPTLRQRIAGKSIPLEKLVARKARKFQEQKGRLALAALEFGYLFLCIEHAPRTVILSHMLPQTDALLAELQGHRDRPTAYDGYFWDDWCLAQFLRGVCLRYVAYPDADTVPDDAELPMSQADAERDAVLAFEAVFADGDKIALDHYLNYFAHFEYGRLLACKRDKAGAREHLELVMSGKSLEGPGVHRKGKYSMENGLHVRTHAALEALDRKDRL